MAFGDFATLRDNFNRADQTHPMTGWTAWISSGLQVISNQCAPMDAGDNASYFSTAMTGPDVEAYITIATHPAAGGQSSLSARLDPSTGGSGSAYSVEHNPVAGTDTIDIAKTIAGTWTRIGGPYNQELAAGDKLGIRCIGNVIEAWVFTSGAWTLVGSVTDSALPGTGNQNKIGFYNFGNSAGTGARYDDLFAGVIPVFSSFATLKDSFTRANEGHPMTGWTAWGSSGLQVISNQCAPVDSGSNSAYFNTGLSASDVEAYVTIATPPADGGENAIYARIDPSTGGQGDFYGISHLPVSGTDTITIQRSIAGTVTSIGGPFNQNLVAGDKLGIRCIGSIIQAWAFTGGSWVFVGSAIDSSVPGTGAQNKIAFYNHGANVSTVARYDDLFGGVISPLNIDTGTVSLGLRPSSTDVAATIDSGTARLSLTPSAAELYIPPGGIIVPPIATPSPGPPRRIPVVKRFTVFHYTHGHYALGDVYPKNLDFAIYLNRIGYCNYDIDMSHVLAKKENTSPYETDFVLYRGDNPIIGGEHTSINIQGIEVENMSVSGQDWCHYLERQQYPFNPDDPLANAYLVTGRDTALVVKDILTTILARPGSLDVDLSGITAIGNLIDYKIDPNDTGDIYNKIVDLAKRFPGFDYEITPGRQFNIYSPQKGTNTGITLVQGHNIFDVAYTNNGPVATHTLGLAQAASTKLGVIVDSVAPQFRRADANQDFADIDSLDELTAATIGEAARNVSPHREITLKVIPKAFDVWETLSVGDTVNVNADIRYEHIVDDFRIVGMQCTVSDEGDEEWSLTLDDGTLSL